MINMNCATRWAGVTVVAAGLFIGCADRADRADHGRAPADIETTAQPQPLRTTEPAVDRLATDLLTARNTTEEADAMKRLWNHISREQLTYELQAFAIGSNQQIESPTTHRGRLRAQVQIFRGKEKVYQFSFIPQDNSNLALLGGEA
jgi:hypothetical protein